MACKHCRHCQHVFIPGGGKRRSRAPDSGRAAAAAGSGSSGASTQRKRPQPSSSSSFFASYASSVPSHSSFPSAPSSSSALDDNQDTCAICSDTGRLLCCDVCPLAYHLDCVALDVIPKGHWACPRCVMDQAASAEKAGEAAARDSAEAGGAEAGATGQGGAGEGGKPGKAAGGLLHGLDSEQQRLWCRLCHAQAEETEVDGLLFVCFPPPAAEEAKEEAERKEVRKEESGVEPALPERPALLSDRAAADDGQQTSAEVGGEALAGRADRQLEAALPTAVSVS